MAGGMKRATASGVLAAAIFLFFGAAAGAQIVNDPTRPPAALSAPEAADGAATRGPVLQSVKISRTERSAIIGGEMVRLGAKYGEARVVRITENEVVLRSAGGTEVLRMYPGVEIKPAVPASTVRQSPAGKVHAPTNRKNPG